jgi:leader peptidase (prepilin peptidase)/N-methyltransferase
LAALGAWTGLAGVLPTILLSSFIGAVVGSIWLAINGRDKATPIPFGPYLAFAGWISFFWGKDLVGAYLRFAGLA